MRSIQHLVSTIVVIAIAPIAPSQIVLFEDWKSPRVVSPSGFDTISTGSTLGVWSVPNGTVDLIDSSRVDVSSFDGTQAVDLIGTPGLGRIETTFATGAELEYVLSFWYSRNLNGSSSAMASVEITDMGGAELLTETVTSSVSSPDTFEFFAGTFTAASNTTTLAFEAAFVDSSFAGIVLDTITVQVVPAGPTAAIFAAAGIVSSRRRR